MRSTAEIAVPMPNIPEMDVMWTVMSNLLTDVNLSGKEVGYSITEEPKYTNESGTEITIEDLGPTIKAFGNPQSWNLQINTLKEFETTGEDVNICIRVYAVGKTGKVSEPVLVPFIIDPQSPRIGNTTPLQLVQYASDETTIKARIKYNDFSLLVI